MAAFASSPRTDWVLVTGQPGCGKTTAVKALVAALQRRGAKVRGFYTDEVLGRGSRVGFDVVTVPDGARGVLSRKGLAGPKCGAYGVDVEAFERLALPTLAGDEVYVLDEIGRMELKSAAFAERVEALLGVAQHHELGRRRYCEPSSPDIVKETRRPTTPRHQHDTTPAQVNVHWLAPGQVAGYLLEFFALLGNPGWFYRELST